MFRMLAASILVLLGLAAGPAYAQNPKIFIASTGSDSNPGTREQPMRSLQAAHNAVPANGSIVILDTAGYAGVTITKSVSIYVPPGVSGFASILGGTNGVVINAAPTDTVSIRGLFIEGSGTTSGRGIYATSVGSLTIEDCIVRNFSIGISVESSSPVKLTIDQTAVRNVSSGLKAVASTGAINGTVTGLRVDSADTDAIGVFATGLAVASLVASDCNLTNNTNGIHVGAGATAVVADRCTITGSTYAFFKDQLLSGGLFSRGNNTAFNNANNLNLLNIIVPLVAL